MVLLLSFSDSGIMLGCLTLLSRTKHNNSSSYSWVLKLLPSKVNSQPCHALVSHPHTTILSHSSQHQQHSRTNPLSTQHYTDTLNARLAAHSLHFHTPPQHLALSNKNDESDIWSLTHNKHTPKNSHQTVALLSFLSLVLVLLSHALNYDSSLLSKWRIY